MCTRTRITKGKRMSKKLNGFKSCPIHGIKYIAGYPECPLCKKEKDVLHSNDDSVRTDDLVPVPLCTRTHND